MKITLWGVRGSIPTPGPDTVEFGGNTSCIKVRCVRRLVHHHHDPMQSDAAVQEKERRCRELFPETIAGREGLTIEL